LGERERSHRGLLPLVAERKGRLLRSASPETRCPSFFLRGRFRRQGSISHTEKAGASPVARKAHVSDRKTGVVRGGKPVKTSERQVFETELPFSSGGFKALSNSLEK